MKQGDKKEGGRQEKTQVLVEAGKLILDLASDLQCEQPGRNPLECSIQMHVALDHSLGSTDLGEGGVKPDAQRGSTDLGIPEQPRGEDSEAADGEDCAIPAFEPEESECGQNGTCREEKGEGMGQGEEAEAGSAAGAPAQCGVPELEACKSRTMKYSAQENRKSISIWGRPDIEKSQNASQSRSSPVVSEARRRSKRRSVTR